MGGRGTLQLQCSEGLRQGRLYQENPRRKASYSLEPELQETRESLFHCPDFQYLW